MAKRRLVEIEAYTPEDKQVLQLVIPTYEWYGGTHPVIDSNEERVRLHISRIEGRQYNADGDLIVRWNTTYAADGSIIEDKSWNEDGSVDFRKLQADGSLQHIHSPSEN